MQAIILAAGKGTRFGDITKKIPKSLIPVCGKPIIEYTLSSLPSLTKEVNIIVGHLGEQIKSRIGNKFGKINVKYIEAKELNGTGGAVWATKNQMKGKFLVLNGDDIYWKDELEALVRQSWSAGLAETIPQGPQYLTFNLDENEFITGARHPNQEEMKNGILISTGAFVLDPNIFKYQLVPIGDGKEFGLPQTILKAIKKHPTKGVLMKNWIQINRLEDVKIAEKILNKKRD